MNICTCCLKGRAILPTKSAYVGISFHPSNSSLNRLISLPLNAQSSAVSTLLPSMHVYISATVLKRKLRHLVNSSFVRVSKHLPFLDELPTFAPDSTRSSERREGALLLLFSLCNRPHDGTPHPTLLEWYMRFCSCETSIWVSRYSSN